jgi:hypothetical protein
MTQDEIDTMWQQAMRQSIEEGEMSTRYHFAKLVAAKERERIYKAKEWCILCEQKGVCNENTKNDETNTAKILGKS